MVQVEQCLLHGKRECVHPDVTEAGAEICVPVRLRERVWKAAAVSRFAACVCMFVVWASFLVTFG